MKNYKAIFRDYDEKNEDNKVSYTTIFKIARGLLNKPQKTCEEEDQEELKEESGNVPIKTKICGFLFLHSYIIQMSIIGLIGSI